MEKEKQAHFDIHTPSPSHSEEGPTFEDEDFESYMKYIRFFFFLKIISNCNQK